jgi:hypothetical protein
MRCNGVDNVHIDLRRLFLLLRHFRCCRVDVWLLLLLLLLLLGDLSFLSLSCVGLFLLLASTLWSNDAGCGCCRWIFPFCCFGRSGAMQCDASVD